MRPPVTSTPHLALAVLLAYAAVALAVYGSTLNIFFMSDDFEFLQLVASARNASVVFDTLQGRFVRPLVVLMYYANYRTIGLAPFGYHLSTILPHVLSAWLVCLVAARLSEEGINRWAFVAGLLFVVFSGHSEAVSWPAGIADPLVTMFVLAAFLLYLGYLDPGASRAWLWATFAALAGAMLAKETWVVFPALVIVHAVVYKRRSRRVLEVVLGSGVLVVLYLVLRFLAVGNVAGGYAVLGSSLREGIFVEQARAFLLRCFLPAGEALAGFWLRGWDIVLVVSLGALVIWRLRRGPARTTTVTAAALLVSLVPVLPLTISVASTESERYVYLATAFSSMLMVSMVRTLVPWRVAAGVVLAATIVVHALALVRANRVWQASGTMTRQVLDSFEEQVLRHDPGGRAAVFMLNLPDNVRGAYTWRNGFREAVRVFTPQLAHRTNAIHSVATQSLASPDDVTKVRRDGARFAVDLGRNRVIQPTIPSWVYYTIRAQRATGYTVEFEPSLDRALVLFLSGGHLRLAGVVDGPGLPFGRVEVPASGQRCAGESLTFSGWALDRQGVRDVTLSVNAMPAGDPVLRDKARWMTGARTDIARAFAGLPNANRAAWEYRLLCAIVNSAPGRRVRVRVTAEDEWGNTAVIGEREVRSLQ